MFRTQQNPETLYSILSSPSLASHLYQFSSPSHIFFCFYISECERCEREKGNDKCFPNVFSNELCVCASWKEVSTIMLCATRMTSSLSLSQQSSTFVIIIIGVGVNIERIKFGTVVWVCVDKHICRSIVYLNTLCASGA
jgi:hypothetical protein